MADPRPFHTRGTLSRDGKLFHVVVVHFPPDRTTTYHFDSKEDADGFVRRVLGAQFPEVRDVR